MTFGEVSKVSTNDDILPATGKNSLRESQTPNEINANNCNNDSDSSSNDSVIDLRRNSDDDDIETGKERRSRRDGAMKSVISRERGRTPSPKRCLAPVPPSPRDCPSPVPKLVSTSDVIPADCQGWLIDQLRGKKVWCAVSDMLFCVFDKEDSPVSKQVILLPGCKVRHLEFKSASQDGKVLNGVARHFASKTITGVDKFQFLIENSISRQKHMFGVSSRGELDLWMDILEKACSLEVTSETPEKDPNETLSNGKLSPRTVSGTVSPRSRSKQGSSLTSPPAYSPGQTLPKRIDIHSLSMSLTQPHDVSKDTVDGIRKRLRKEHHEQDSKPIPLRATYCVEESTQKPEETHKEENNRKSRGFFKMRSPLDVFLRRKKRSSSADDAQAHARRKMFPVMEPDNVSIPSFSPRLSDSQTSLVSSHGSNQSLPSQDTSFTSSADSKGSRRVKRRGFLSKSYDAQNSSKGLGSGIKRTASDLREKMFGSGSAKDSKSKPGVQLKDLKEIHVSGYLHYRLAFKFTKVFCALCRGCFYAFKLEKPEESPILAVVLNQCSVTYVAEPEKRQKRLFAFKLSQSHCKSIYISVDDHQTLIKWMMALQTEASKIQVDEELATEIREKRSSQKKRQARELKMSLNENDRAATEREMKSKRNSCPSFDSKSLPEDAGLTNLDKTESKEITPDGMSPASLSLHRSKSDRGMKVPIDIYYDGYLTLPSKTPETNSKSDYTDSSKISAGSTHSQLEDRHDGTTSNFPIIDRFAEAEIPRLSLPAGEDQETHETKHNRSFSTHSSGFQHIKTSVKRSASFDKTIALSKPARELDIKRPNFYLPTSVQQDKTTSFSYKSVHDSALYSHSVSVHTQIEGNGENNSWVKKSLNQTTASSCSSFGENKHPYRIDSNVHDDAVKEAWSTNEDFLLDVIREKLRRKRQREPSEIEEGPPINHVYIVNDEQTSIIQNGTAEHCPELMDSKVASEMSDYKNSQEKAFYSENLWRSSESKDPETPLINQGRIPMEGFVEKRGFDEQWHRYWCCVRDGYLYCYLKPDDQVSADVTDLRGYDITQLVDQFKGKRFVLSLEHKDYINVLLSVDSREEMEDWYYAIKSFLESLSQSDVKGIITNQGNCTSKFNASQGLAPGNDVSQSASSAETVKQKLLAEMLRQKLELEKMQAARNGLKTSQQLDGSERLSSSPKTRKSPISATDEDRVCALTRLRQRRMSTQIKLSAIQKEMDLTSPREKKTVFQIGKKRPDLVQDHSDLRPDLEQQVKSLSSRLEELNTCITSHEVISPRDHLASSKENLRHSYDLSFLKNTEMINEKRTEIKCEGDGESSPKLKDRDVNKSTSSLKSSVQKLAHRTFAKANWHWHKKGSNHSDEKDDSKATSSSNHFNFLSDQTPDVIDMTKSNIQLKETKNYAQDDNSIPAPPDKFRTDYTLLNSTFSGRQNPGLHKSPKDRVMSKLVTSSSMTNIDRFMSRMKETTSFPSLKQAPIKQNDKSRHQHLRTASSSDHDILKSNSQSLERYFSKSVPNSARGEKSSGALSPRREVNPNALAEIEAFEELSLKFLGTTDAK